MTYQVMTDSLMFSKHETLEGAEHSMAQAITEARDAIADLKNHIESLRDFIASLKIT